MPLLLSACTSLSRTPFGVQALSNNGIHKHLFERLLNPRTSGLATCNMVRTILSNMAAGNEEVAIFLCEATSTRASESLLQSNAWHGTMILQNNQDILLLKELVHSSTYRAEAGISSRQAHERSSLVALACKTLSSEKFIANAVLVENTVLPMLDFVKQGMTNSTLLKEIVQAVNSCHRADVFQYLGEEFSRIAIERDDVAGLSCLLPWLIAALCSSSKLVRDEVLQILSHMLHQGEALNIRVGRLLLSALPNLTEAPYSDFLSAVSLCLCNDTIIMKFSDSHNLADVLLTMLQNKLELCSKYTVSELAVFSSLNSDAAASFLSVSTLLNDVFTESTQFMTKFTDTGLETLVRAALCARTLRLCQMPNAVSASQTFDDILSICEDDSQLIRPQIARICVKLAQAHVSSTIEHKEKCLPLHIILNELASSVLPRAPPQKSYLMRLLKSATQEEFIPGAMSRNPYSTAQLRASPLMRDVKNLICRELDMPGLIEDDFGMELLVANQIINLDLSVEAVFERIWIPSLFNGGTLRRQADSLTDALGPPMAVTFRLSGLDGEATEERIDELPPIAQEDEDVEAKFAGTKVFLEANGFKTLIQLLPKIRKTSSLPHTGSENAYVKLLEILRSACHLKKNRQHMLSLGALASLLDEAAQAFTENVRSGKELLPVIEMLLTEEQADSEVNNLSGVHPSSSSVCQPNSLLARELEGSGFIPPRSGSPRLQRSGSSLQTIALSVREQGMNHVAIFLAQLKYCIQNRERHEADILARVIPRLAGSTLESRDMMAMTFDASVRKLVDLDTMSDGDVQHRQLELELQCSARLAEAIPPDLSGQRVLEAIWSKGTVSFILDYLLTHVFASEDIRQRGSVGWTEALQRNGLPLALELLDGIIEGYDLAIDANEDVLDLLHKLESVSEKNIGTLSENCLETLARTSKSMQEHLEAMREATRDENRRKALAKREQMLAEMGMKVIENTSSPGASTIGVSVSPRSLHGYESMVVESEEDSIVCRVCFEGYVLKPNELLGVYCFNRLASTPSANGDLSQTVCTVSHFNAIHFSCHQSAKRADIALRVPKREWDGAALRNSETLCNNLLPITGKIVSDSAYATAVDAWWQNCFSIGAFISPPSRARQVAWDVGLLLGRFAMNASFSTDCRGGGKESNAHLLPHLMRLLVHQISLSPHKGLEEYNALLSRLSGENEVWDDTETSFSPILPAALSLSLTIWSNEKWSAARRNVLVAVIRHARKYGCSRIATYPITASADASWDEVSETERFSRLKPMLIYLGLVNRMYEWLKPARGGVGKAVNIAKPALATTNEPSEGAKLCERVRDTPAMMAGVKDFLEWLEEAQDSADAPELLDVCRCLHDAMCPTVDDFITRALALSP